MEREKLTRRELLQRLSALAGGLILTGPISGCAGFWQREPAVPVDSWHKGVCRFCGTGCGIMIGVRDGRVVDIKGDEYAHNRGRLCVKGVLNREILYVRDRALYPMIRRNGRLERASWDEAMDLVARRFREAIDRYGPDSVAFYGSGQLFTEESYTANKLFKAGIGTNNVDGNPRLCMASAAAGYISVFGKDEPLGCYEDIDAATCFFITGSNTADCHPIVWERVLDRKRSRPETVIIVVDPRRTRTARHADYHLPIRPGTDVALYNAMIYEFIRNGFIDQDMVENYLTFREGNAPRTFEDLKRHVAQYAPERVASICGIDARLIEEVAYLFAASEATMSIWTMGLNQQAQGTAANRLINAMHLLTGHIGRPGATPFSLTGQPNAGGGVRDTGALAHALPNGRVVTNPKHRAEMEDLWGVPRGRISPKPGYHAVAMFEAMRRGDLKCVLIMGTNPAQSLPHADRYREAMARTFLVVADAVYPTETTQFADVFLPTAMWVEKGGVYSQSERRYHLVPKLVDPPGEARSDLEILIELADRLGYGELIKARTPEAIWDEWRQISAHSPYNFAGITYERLKKERGILWPAPTEDHPGTCRRYVPGEDPMAKGTGRFDFYGRPDGRAVVFLEHQKPPSDPRTDAYPLTLVTGRVYEHWHTLTLTGKLKELEDITTDFLVVHPRDAHRYGIRDGEPVLVESRRGRAVLQARVSTDITPGVVFAPFHSPEALVNRVVNPTVDPISKEPAFKESAVRIRPVSPAA
ncbi:molybdopterin oxidoreductase family protein [Rhodothermus profundi]|uniref:Periplasmic nitrate reductase subunit NapA apoprotein n=1 Tax=Rhodothermus profundi TaxID=633813 RepID=A0A1M6QP41_9BACT|nr:nitrate reductase [Rhodothermus profundi]SHK21777.1 periplasmic nitrate reductase subunit NapA apoprotein [Rhodothermus profundi]